MSPITYLRLAGIPAILCVAICTVAQPRPQYFYTENFGIEEGLHHGSIRDFQIDENGFLWINTIGSLQLFDGKEFIDMDQYKCESVLLGSFNYDISTGLFFIHDRYVQRINTADYTSSDILTLTLPQGSSGERENALLYENARDLFIWHRNDTIYQVRKQNLEITARFTLPENPSANLLNSDIGHYTPTLRQIEYVNESLKLCVFDVESRKLVSERQLTQIVSVTRISRDTFATLDVNHLNIYVGDQVIEVDLPAPVQDFWGRYLMLGPAGSLLVGLKDNIYAFDVARLQWIAVYEKAGDDKLIDIKMRQMRHDRLGNIYFSSLNEGFFKLYPRNSEFEYIGTKSKAGNFVRCICVSDLANRVLMGTLQDGLYLFDTLGFLHAHILQFPGSGEERYISSILELSKSEYLILGQAAHLLTFYNDTFSLREVTGLDPGWLSYYSCAVETGDTNTHFLSTRVGLLTIQNSPEIRFHFQEDHALHGSSVICRFGNGFLSATPGKLSVFDAQLSQIKTAYSIPDFGLLRSIAEYGDSRILLGADLGLFIIDFEEDTANVKKVYDGTVYSVLQEEHTGNFWFGTDYGLNVLNADLMIMNYSKENGLQENEFNTNVACRSASGKMYFGGVNGITAFSPSRVRPMEGAEVAFVSRISVNNTVLDRLRQQDAHPRYVLSYKENNIGIELLGKGARSPLRYNYQYLLERHDRYWVDMGRNSEIQLHLSPGNYRIYYAVLDRFDPIAARQHYVEFIITPPVYQRWWFRALGAAGLVVVLWTVFRTYRKRQTMRLQYELQLNQHVQHERMRISRDLHDNIGAQMATVRRNLNFLINANTVLSESEVMEKMRHIENISGQINQELRDTIWAVQHAHVTLSEVIARIKDYVFQALGQDNTIRVQYREDCQGDMLLGPFVALNLHRICQEVISNAIKHSRASALRVVFEGDKKALKITVSDNGSGFDLATVTRGYGLRNIQSRASQIGASVFFNRQVEQGSSIEIELSDVNTSNNSKVQ